MLTDPRIDTFNQTSFACPESYTGQLRTGEFFYFRYRNGYASLYLSWTAVPYGTISADSDNGIGVGDSLQGIFDDDEQRNGVFKLLLDELDKGAGFDSSVYGL